VAEKEKDYTGYASKAATPLQQDFAEWLLSDEVGYDPSAAKTKRDAFEEGVRLAVALRIPFQASDFNRERTADRRSQRATPAVVEAVAPKTPSRKVAAPTEEAAAPAPAKRRGRAAKAETAQAPASASEAAAEQTETTTPPAATRGRRRTAATARPAAF
jgi:hypothetical protein